MNDKKHNNYLRFLNNMVEHKVEVDNKPIQLMFGLTNVCNLHCSFCPYCGFCSSKIEMVHMMPMEWVDALKPYLSAAQFVNPSGRGEPLLYKNFEEFIDVCRECDALSSMQLTNNGTQLQRYDLKKFEGINIVAISIDSVNKETFEILRYGAKLDLVLDNCVRLRKELPYTVLQWCVVVNRLNIDQLVDIYMKAREIGIDYITFNDVYGYEEDKVIQLLRLREQDKKTVENQFKIISDLNKDGKLTVNNVISWSGFEDGKNLNSKEIYDKLNEMKSMEPYLNFDELNCEEVESRRIKEECRSNTKGARIPYCTNPFEVMFIQPDGAVSPCCASYGTIDRIKDNNIEKVWNGKNYQLLREAMFDWEMLPEYCKKCEAFMRYDYIDDYWNLIEDKENVLIPPNYYPPTGTIKNEELLELIEKKHQEEKGKNSVIRDNNLDVFLTEMVEQNTIISNSPIELLIGLTNVCNLHCAFCLYCGFCMKKIQSKEMLSWDAIEKLRKYLSTAEIVIPSGRGEPLIYENFEKFMNLCRETGAIQKMQLVNNGTLLNRYDPEIFDGTNILSISFDSVHKEIFELLRCGSNYELIINNIKTLREKLPNAIIQFSVTVNRLNMEEIADIYRLARRLGINYISYNSLYGYEEDKVIQLLHLRKADKKIIEKQLKLVKELNSDNKIEIVDVITWEQEDDGEVYNKEQILLKLKEMKESIVPYLDYDELDMYDVSTRAIHKENRKENKKKNMGLPYCTNPYCVFMVQPNENVSPCCASFGTISNMKEKSVDEVWNGEEYQLLREGMFNYEMLPDYCKECRSFVRYDYINEYIDKLKQLKTFNYQELVIPPNYYPPEGLIKDQKIASKIAISNKINGLESKQDLINSIQSYEIEISELENKVENLERKNEDSERRINELDGKTFEDTDEYKRFIELRDEAYGQCKRLAGKTSYKLVHAFQRVYRQLLKGNMHEKKLFFEWVGDQLSGKKQNADHRYNPIYSVIGILDKMGRENLEEINVSEDNFPEQLNEILSEEYKLHDVIIFGVIDYDFRFQRPQHFASRFAENGHRVFYINPNYHKSSCVEKINKNLFVVNIHNDRFNAVYTTDWSEQKNQMEKNIDNLMYQYGIRDAIAIVDYPNWVNVAEYIRKKYGFRIITDYMDDYTGFLNETSDMLVQNCKKLLSTSDLIIPSSQFLCDIAEKYSDKCDIVRNGTEFKHFYKAKELAKEHERKVIGYYGAVSHWFDREKVCYVAKAMPECDVVIVGQVSEEKEELEKIKNIKLLGEKPYTELPKYLAEFDVCLIPFDTSTDLIKATNPVKFYEYLSAGKKVVATEIPELMPFKDDYVYMSNDNEEFLHYIKICLNGTDELKSEEERIAFAKENDWQQRYIAFAEQCNSIIPKISVIVLTYNNLDYNKSCIETILNQTAYPNYELIIIDNKSTDGTIEYLEALKEKDIPNVQIVLNSENLGFAGGNNEGIKRASGDYVVLLNNDTVISRGWLTSMEKHLAQKSELGMIGLTTNSIGNECKVVAKYSDMVEFRKFAYQLTAKKMGKTYNRVKMLPLFCTMIKKSVIDEAGMLDPIYKVGMFEDDDFAEAVKEKGYELAIADDAFIHHYDGGSFKKLEDARYKAIFEENKAIFEEKWHKEWVPQRYREGVDWDTNAGMQEVML